MYAEKRRVSVNFVLLTQLPVRLGSELPSDGLALMRTRFEVSSTLEDGIT